MIKNLIKKIIYATTLLCRHPKIKQQWCRDKWIISWVVKVPAVVAVGRAGRAAARSGARRPRLARVVGTDHVRLRHAAPFLLRERESICIHADTQTKISKSSRLRIIVCSDMTQVSTMIRRIGTMKLHNRVL